MRKRTTLTLIAVFLLLCALATALFLRWKAPPEVARLLPEADAIVYLNLKPLRVATQFDRNPVPPSPSYQQFIDATGIVAERDLDSAALALHRMPDPTGPNGPAAFSEVFEGRFDPTRLTRYLSALSTSQETYANHTIYFIPTEGRTLRIALLGYDMVVGSNMPTPEQIHSILDKQRTAASPFAGSSLLNARYKDVPALSIAWAIGHIGLPFSHDGKISVLGLELPLPADSMFVASLGLSTGLHPGPGAIALRIDQIAPDQSAAARSVESLNSLLSLFRSVQLAQSAPRTPAEAALRQSVDSIAIEQHKDRASLTAILPAEAIKGLEKR